MRRQEVSLAIKKVVFAPNTINTYEPIAMQWIKWCESNDADPKVVPDEDLFNRFIDLKNSIGTKHVARSAIRAFYSGIGAAGAASVGKNMKLGRSPIKDRPSVPASSIALIESFVKSKMYSQSIYMAAISLIVCGVNVGRVVQLGINDFSRRVTSDGEVSYMVRRSWGTDRMIEVRGIFAKSIEVRLAQMADSGSSVFAESPRGRFTRQGIWKMMNNSGIYLIPGVCSENVYGCISKKEITIMGNEEKSQSMSEEAKTKVKDHVAERAAKTPVFDPQTNKMKILTGGGGFIETELTEKFVDHLRKQGYDVTYKNVKPSEKVEEAAKSIFADRMQLIMEDVMPMCMMADMNPDRAMQMMKMTVDSSFRGIQTDPESTIKFIDAVLAWMIINRACVLAGKIDP